MTNQEKELDECARRAWLAGRASMRATHSNDAREAQRQARLAIAWCEEADRIANSEEKHETFKEDEEKPCS
jgi:hypothetical protein